MKLAYTLNCHTWTGQVTPGFGPTVHFITHKWEILCVVIVSKFKLVCISSFWQYYHWNSIQLGRQCMNDYSI